MTKTTLATSKVASRRTWDPTASKPFLSTDVEVYLLEQDDEQSQCFRASQGGSR